MKASSDDLLAYLEVIRGFLGGSILIIQPDPGDLPDPGIEPQSPTLQADALPSKPPGKSEMVRQHHQFNGHEFEQAPGDGEGQGNRSCCSPWGCRVGQD